MCIGQAMKVQYRATGNEQAECWLAGKGGRQLRGGNGRTIVSDKSCDITDSRWKLLVLSPTDLMISQIQSVNGQCIVSYKSNVITDSKLQ